jgi:dethiobiotin synthetase
MSGLFVTGTDTGVGKTAVTAYLTALLRKSGITAVPFKPVQSGGRNENGRLIAEDIEEYMRASEIGYKQEELCLYCLEEAVSPHLAAKLSRINIEKEKLMERYRELESENKIVLVEGAGGLAVPISEIEEDLFLTKDLILELSIPAVIVTTPFLGTINHSVLTAEYADRHGIEVAGFIVNKVSSEEVLMEQDNMRMIERISGLPVIGRIPAMTSVDYEEMLDGEPLIDLNYILKKEQLT